MSGPVIVQGRPYAQEQLANTKWTPCFFVVVVLLFLALICGGGKNVLLCVWGGGEI